MKKPRKVTFQCTRCGGDDIGITGLGQVVLISSCKDELNKIGDVLDCSLIDYDRFWLTLDVICRSCGKVPFVCRSPRIGLRAILSAGEVEDSMQPFMKLQMPGAQVPKAKVMFDWDAWAGEVAYCEMMVGK